MLGVFIVVKYSVSIKSMEGMWVNTLPDRPARHRDHHGGGWRKGLEEKDRQVTVIPDAIWEVPQENSSIKLWGPAEKGIGKGLIKTPVFEKI